MLRGWWFSLYSPPGLHLASLGPLGEVRLTWVVLLRPVPGSGKDS